MAKLFPVFGDRRTGGVGRVGGSFNPSHDGHVHISREAMKRLGLHVYGDFNSPIIPVMIYFPSKIAAFSRECLKRGLAIVVVGFPATSVVLSRARFCISAGHTKEDLDRAIKIIDEVTDLICLKYNKSFIGL